MPANAGLEEVPRGQAFYLPARGRHHPAPRDSRSGAAGARVRVGQPRPAVPDSLRARGIARVRWGTGGLLVGAFETPEQAALARTQLKRAGVQATLVTRVGSRP